jgi:tetratricopeptide (TPR) repeat protein/predicted aspartyl protease
MLRQRPIPSAATVPAKSPGRRSGIAVGLLLATTALAAPQVRAAGCTLTPVAEMPVTMIGTTPSVHAKINGRDALFIADSGAFYNTLTPSAAAEYDLHQLPATGQDYIEGVGGSARAYVTQVDTFTIFNTAVPKVAFVVAGNDLPGGAVGLLGQNIFHIGDVEYDLANGMIRIMRPKDCLGTALAYWSASTQKPYSVIDIELSNPHQPHTKSVAYLNGEKIKVMFDTGSSRSLLTRSAAKRAGITPDSPGVLVAGNSWGLGRNMVKTWIAPFASFKIGDEEVRNVRLRFAETESLDTDMLIGADFFLSHRIYVASSQKKLYFTYNGGPVFNLDTAPVAAKESSAAEATPPEVPAGQTQVADVRLDEPTDADGFARRGAAYTARRDYTHAISDLTRACELAPTEVSYFYQRGVAHWANHEPDAAREDFDKALKLKPDDLSALTARATLSEGRHESPEALAAYLDAADRAMSDRDDARMRLGLLYLHAGQPQRAVLQYSKWIDTHERDEVHMTTALNDRCWARALWGQQLEEALADCNAALKTRPGTSAFLDSRGLVYLRKGDFKKSVSDYDAALHMQGRSSWSLYGRGIALLRTGETARGQADIAAALVVDKNISTEAAQYGIAP